MDHCIKEPKNEKWDNVNGSLNTQFNAAFSGTDSFLSKWRSGVMEDNPLFFCPPSQSCIMLGHERRQNVSPLLAISIHRVIILDQSVIFLINVCHICGFKENCASQNMGSIYDLQSIFKCMAVCCFVFWKVLRQALHEKNFLWQFALRCVLDDSVCMLVFQC